MGSNSTLKTVLIVGGVLAAGWIGYNYFLAPGARERRSALLNVTEAAGDYLTGDKQGFIQNFAEAGMDACEGLPKMYPNPATRPKEIQRVMDNCKKAKATGQLQKYSPNYNPQQQARYAKSYYVLSNAYYDTAVSGEPRIAGSFGQ